ncbi:sensor histidine kinase [Paenibacillus sp. YN15]|uniref:cache domain-containing sensor histidine kinase n=1 Tax=Paenibacillus sp. YN15 TaxID=1742774 RepID=UPI000DCD48E5|nr:sensor histidine kinase [Paenibacillus sp. YN15]RAV05170.1 sensor histidine kinase [Paenibacillus sp. YN15]
MRWVRSSFAARSFRSKLILASVACILLPALGTMMVYNYLTRDAVKDQAIQNADQTLKLVEGHVSNEFRYMLYLMNYFTVDQDILFLLKNLAAEPYDRNRETEEQFLNGNEVRKSISSLTAAGQQSFVSIVLNNGMAFTNYWGYEYDPRLLLDKPWVKESENTFGLESYWAGVMPTVFSSEKARNPYQITSVRPLRGDRNAIYGYVVVTVMESLIHQYFEGLPTRQEIMLLDREDRILSHTDSGLIGSPFPEMREVLSREGTPILQRGGIAYLVSEKEISIGGWKLVSLTPYKSAVAKINDIFQNVFLFQLVSFILFFLLLLVLLRAFTKPLVKLDKVALRVQQGDLEVRSSIRGQDEVGRLGKSFDQMLDRISDMIREITETQARKRKAELDMLQAQINPHFLFNVMNSIRMKVMRNGDRESADMLSSLSKLLRMTIQDTGNIPLHDEVETAIDYVLLMNMRQKQEVALEVDIAADVLMERVPRFVLQPLIENALIHGLNQMEGTIYLHAKREEGAILIQVRDNGKGMDAAALEGLRRRMLGLHGEAEDRSEKRGFSGIGLANVYERMRMTFGSSFSMEIESEEGAGTCISMYLPL